MVSSFFLFNNIFIIINTREKMKNISKYINNVKEFLESRYGNVNEEWMAIIELLKDNLILYEMCKKSIEENGIYDKKTGKKNPLLSTMKDLQATIIKQIQHLGLSPYAVSRIKQEENDDTDSFINSLIND